LYPEPDWIRLSVQQQVIAVAKKVLIVEDNELNLRLFQDLLRAHGADVEGVRDARIAVERIRAFMPDLVIMDIHLPHVSGVELIQRLREEPALARLPVMAVTAYAGKGDEQRIRDAGADAYVSKPITVMRFLTSVENLIGPLDSGVAGGLGLARV
jgi:two-component system cell cycle response regulator DivK